MPEHNSRPPRPPPKNAQTLPPTYLAHLSALLRQFLSQQLHTSGPSPNSAQREDRPIWDPGAVAKLHQAVWEGGMLHQGATAGTYGVEDGKAGLLGCDWDSWLEGAVRRRQAAKARRELEFLPTTPAVCDLGRRGGGLQSGSATPSRNGTRESSVVSKQRDGASSIHHASETGNAATSGTHAMDDFCAILRSLPGFVAFGGQEGWDLVAGEPRPMHKTRSIKLISDTSPARTPIRDLPGAFPQMSSAWSPHASTSRTLTKAEEPAVPLPDQLLIALCVQFVPSSPAMTMQSSASTMRTARESSNDPTTLSTILSPPQLTHSLSGMFSGKSNAQSHPGQAPVESPPSLGDRQGSGGKSSGLGLNWWTSKWSEGSKGQKVEIEFVPGRFALPRGHARSSSRTRNCAELDDEDGVVEGESDSDSDASDWSGTQRAHKRDAPLKVLLSGIEPDLQLGDDVGIVGGTFVIKGIRAEEEREALIRVLKGTVSVAQKEVFTGGH